MGISENLFPHKYSNIIRYSDQVIFEYFKNGFKVKKRYDLSDLLNIEFNEDIIYSNMMNDILEGTKYDDEFIANYFMENYNNEEFKKWDKCNVYAINKIKSYDEFVTLFNFIETKDLSDESFNFKIKGPSVPSYSNECSLNIYPIQNELLSRNQLGLYYFKNHFDIKEEEPFDPINELYKLIENGISDNQIFFPFYLNNIKYNIKYQLSDDMNYLMGSMNFYNEYKDKVIMNIIEIVNESVALKNKYKVN